MPRFSTASASASVSRIPAHRPRRGRAAVPTTPLGSLTQREHRAGPTCAVCGSHRVTRLAMQLTDGTPVEFTSCHRCEHRRWEHEGSMLSTESVLERTRKTA
jgi:hypothetical protein